MSQYLGIGFTKLVMGAVFSVGLMLVVIAGAELFTGNNLIVISALVWMAIASRYVLGKILAILFPVMAFVASGYEHSIANIFFITKEIFLKSQAEIVAAAGLSSDALKNLTWIGFFVNNLIPVTIGNILGGALFVAMLYWIVYLKPQENN